MRKIFLKIAYDGTNYAGWQVQKNALSVQQVLDEELTKLFKTPIKTTGASRTDAGVHALGNVACFETDSRMPADKIAFALNSGLPRDIVVQESREVPAEFHPRFDAKEKAYAYKILNTTHPLPLKRFDTMHFHYPLDEEKMKSAASLIIGDHDFTSFSSIHAQTNSFVRTVYETDVYRTDEDEVVFLIAGNGFLYNMVRIIAGTLIEIGTGKREVSEMAAILNARDRGKAGPTAPACGLTLLQIWY